MYNFIIQEKDLHVGGRIMKNIYSSNFIPGRINWLNCLKCFSSRWFFVMMVFRRGGFFSDDFLSRRHVSSCPILKCLFILLKAFFLVGFLHYGFSPGGFSSRRLFVWSVFHRVAKIWVAWFRVAFVGWLKFVTSIDSGFGSS